MASHIRLRRSEKVQTRKLHPALFYIVWRSKDCNNVKTLIAQFCPYCERVALRLWILEFLLSPWAFTIWKTTLAFLQERDCRKGCQVRVRDCWGADRCCLRGHSADCIEMVHFMTSASWLLPPPCANHVSTHLASAALSSLSHSSETE